MSGTWNEVSDRVAFKPFYINELMTELKYNITHTSILLTPWSVTIDSPETLEFPSARAGNINQSVEIDMDSYSWGSLYFTLQDLKWSASGYYVTMSSNDFGLNWSGSGIPAENFSISLTWNNSWVTLIDGKAGTWTEVPPEIQIPPWITDAPIDTPVTVLVRTWATTPNPWILGKYWIQPKFNLIIPKYKGLGSYTSTINFTFIEF